MAERLLLAVLSGILQFQLALCRMPCAVTHIFLQNNGICCPEEKISTDLHSPRDQDELLQRTREMFNPVTDESNVRQSDVPHDANPKLQDQLISEELLIKSKQIIRSQDIQRAKKLEQNESSKPRAEEMKVILFWVSFFGRWDYEFGLGHNPFLEHNCPVSSCLTTQDQGLLSKASAVVFHMRNVRHDTHFPSIRHPNQSYVFFLQENPYNQWNDLALFEGVFNLTMTYRQDSDVHVPYGLITETPSSRLTDEELKTLVDGKSKLVAWFVSNCGPTHSRREEYAKELQKYIPVDIYGKCGPLSCPDKQVSQQEARMDPDCYSMVERKYKFYLSFENMVCKDYVTEKVFSIMGKYVVPVVYGGGNYSDILPPHSVINILDFSSPQHLAEYLKELDGNDAIYMQYFRWKMQYTALSQYRARGKGFCKLCEILHGDKRPGKVYNNLDSWWDKKGSCDLDMPQKLRETYEDGDDD